MLLLPALNQMIDITTTRNLAFQLHPRRVICGMRFLVALTSAVPAGYGTAGGKSRRRLHAIGLAVVIALQLLAPARVGRASSWRQARESEEDTMLAPMRKSIKETFPFIAAAYRACVTSCKQQLSKRRIRRLLKAREEICLELGAGDKKGEGGWVTIDISRNCDVFWDLRNGLPFPDESIKKIYSSHFFEHLTFKEGQKFLDECIRVLVSGGIFSICVPNAKLYMEAYIQCKDLDTNKFFNYKRAYNNTTRIDYVNFIAYMDGLHKYMFDEENLLHILESRGFKNVHLRQFDPSLDSQARDFESIYAEAEK
jgi:predicted SAM-dependent methyltransferase